MGIPAGTCSVGFDYVPDSLSYHLHSGKKVEEMGNRLKPGMLIIENEIFF